MSSKGARQAILPFFIPMQGCGQRCSYCDQWSISGADSAPEVGEIQEACLTYRGAQPAQAAFYGGSFTALPEAQQRVYLEAVQPALAAGLVDSIRVSTRPDAVTAAQLAMLREYGVRVVELGVQSFDTEVLRLAGRVYTPEEAAAACRLVQEAGFILGIQLMTGLPGDNRQKALRSVLQARDLQPAFLRVYPTLVLCNTLLAEWYGQGRYQPQGLQEAAVLAGDLLAIAKAAGIAVIRLGLNPSPSLEAALLAGPYHAAFGQLAQAALKQRQARALLAVCQGAQLLCYPAQERPLLYGQKNAAWQELAADYPGLQAAAADLPPGALAAHWPDGSERLLTEPEFLRGYAAQLACEAEE